LGASPAVVFNLPRALGVAQARAQLRDLIAIPDHDMLDIRIP
jgi:hypothetical protein